MPQPKDNEENKEFIVQAPSFSYQLDFGTAVEIKGHDEEGDDISGIYLVRSNEGYNLLLTKADGGFITLSAYLYASHDYDIEIKILGGTYADGSLPF